MADTGAQINWLIQDNAAGGANVGAAGTAAATAANGAADSVAASAAAVGTDQNP